MLDILSVSPFFCPKKGWAWPFVGPRSALLKDPNTLPAPSHSHLPLFQKNNFLSPLSMTTKALLGHRENSIFELVQSSSSGKLLLGPVVAFFLLLF